MNEEIEKLIRYNELIKSKVVVEYDSNSIIDFRKNHTSGSLKKIIVGLLKGIKRKISGFSTKKIDFERVNKFSLDYVLNEKNNLTKEELENFLYLFLFNQYNIISSILGIDSYSSTCEFAIEELSYRINGQYEIDFYSSTYARVVLNKMNVDSLVDDLFEKRFDLESLYEMTGTIAHELYHRRQHLFFPNFYLKRSERYISGKDPSTKEAYRRQIIEIGARAFAKRYINLFKKQIN